MIDKPVVRYKKDKGDLILLGQSAFIFPIDHPNSLVSNEKMVRTSQVIHKNALTGDFETTNTFYKAM